MSSYRDDLKAFLDGELSEARRAEMETALANDAELRAEKEFFEMLNRSLRTHADAAVSEGNPQVIVDKIRKPGLPFWVRFAPVGAVAGLVLVALLLNMNRPKVEMDVATTATSSAEGFDQKQVADGLNGVDASAYRGRTEANAVPTDDAPKKNWEMMTTPRSLSVEEPQKNGRSKRAPVSVVPQLIRTADLFLTVPEVKDALQHATKIAESEGGYVTNSATGAEEGELGNATATLRIPVKRFTITLERLKKLGKVTNENAGSQDVTAPIADMDARLRVLKAERESYIVMLRAANKVGEMLSIREQISNVSEEIENITAQLKATRDQASYSTIDVAFSEKKEIDKPAPPKDWSSEVWTNAVAGLLEAGRALGAVAIFAFVYAPLWLPLVLLGVWGWRRTIPKR